MKKLPIIILTMLCLATGVAYGAFGIFMAGRPVGSTDALLLENGDYLLLEDGSRLLLE